ncbi:MAG: CDP-diacylglycerol--serine O-phosphatidyltransferase [Fibrobacteres bacterium]|nr:CDP-diacylglycerol--serine O-phosphatidyltransferase [Fibrobacterota bacterium]
MDKDIFIIRLNPVCCLTLAGLAIDMAAFLILLDLPAMGRGASFTLTGGPAPRFFLAVGLMYLGMLTDAFDGIIARRFGWDGEFGRYLDGFVDVFNYLVLPNLLLWRLGFSGPAAGMVMTAMIAAGVLRLSKFNMIGNIKVEGASKYLGLPVFWSQLYFFPLYLVFALVPGRAFAIATGAVWLAMSFAFLYNRPFFKPKNTWLIAGVTLSLSGAGFALFLLGLHP